MARPLADSRRSIKKVRVVDSDAVRRYTSVYSVLIALSAAMVAFLVWHTWRGDEPPASRQRVVSEVEVEWLCSDGHRYRALIQAGAGTCPICGAKSFVVDWYRCPEHGLVDVFGEFSYRDGELTLWRRRVGDGPWGDATGHPRCPKCGSVLRRDPMAGLERSDPGDG